MTVRATSSSRERILGRIRSSIGVSADEADRRVRSQKRLYDHDAHIIPSRSQKSHLELVHQFEDILIGQAATVRRVSEMTDVSNVIAAYLREHNLPARLRQGLDPRLEEINWSAAPHIDRLTGPAHPDDTAGLSHAFAGVSETGTLVMVSGPANPTTLNFLPETHIVVVSQSEIVGPYEGAWTRVREVFGERTMPRTINMISGPSRTADIEQTLIMGAHGPKRLLVIINQNS